MARQKPHPKQSNHSGAGRVRIVGGSWRGRLIEVPDLPGLRPTPDRVRETLFNWLQPVIAETRCLDLFAGSGALGFEAVSRQAARAVMIEADTAVARQLQKQNDIFAANDRVDIVNANALSWLQDAGVRQPFDIVFLDPPFALAVLAESCALLEDRGWLAATSWVYIEDDVKRDVPKLPDNWVVKHSKQAGEVRYSLAHRSAVVAK